MHVHVKHFPRKIFFLHHYGMSGWGQTEMALYLDPSFGRSLIASNGTMVVCSGFCLVASGGCKEELVQVARQVPWTGPFDPKFRMQQRVQSCRIPGTSGAPPGTKLAERIMQRAWFVCLVYLL